MTSKPTLKRALTELEQALLRLGRTFGPAPAWYFRSELTHIANIHMPLQRKRFGEGYCFSQLPHEEQLRYWNFIWQRSTYFEALTQCLLYFEARKNELSLTDWEILRGWTGWIDNWAHADQLSGLVSQLHEHFPKQIFSTLQSWNQSKRPWERRLSIVSLFFYSSQRKTRVPSFSKSRRLVHALLEDDHLYVQKGVGWTLREMYNVYPEQTLAYIEKNVCRIAPAGWQAATEKLTPAVKKRLKSKRSLK